MNDIKSLAIIEWWPLFGRKKAHAQYIAKQYRALGEEVSSLLEQIEKLTPPVESTHIIPIGDHTKVISVMRRTIDAQEERIRELIRELNRAQNAARKIGTGVGI